MLIAISTANHKFVVVAHIICKYTTALIIKAHVHFAISFDVFLLCLQGCIYETMSLLGRRLIQVALAFHTYFCLQLDTSAEARKILVAVWVEPLVRLSSSLREGWMTDLIIAVKAQLGPGMEGHLDVSPLYFDCSSACPRGQRHSVP